MEALKNQTGFSTIAVVVTLMTMSLMGLVIAYMVSANNQNRANHFQSIQALYVNQAATEYVTKKIYEGGSGVFAGPVTFGPGSFTSTLSGNRLTITSTVGNASRIYKLDRPTQATCTSVATAGVATQNSGVRLVGLTFKKNCLASATIAQMTFSWVPNNAFEKLTTIRIENTNVYNNPAGIPSGTTADISDFAMNDANVKTINYIDFFGIMKNKTMTMTFIMADNSTKITSFLVPP